MLGVPLGAVTLLMLLIRHDSAAATTSLFFLVPPTSVFLGWLAFGETMDATGIAGLAITSAGVWLMNRNPERGET